MSIDPNLLDEAEEIPVGATWLNQFTSNQAVRAIIAIVLTGVLAYEILIGQDIHEELLIIISMLMGYYFGENAVNRNGYR